MTPQISSAEILESAGKTALAECRRTKLPEDEDFFEMDYIVRLYHALIEAGTSCTELVFQWKYDLIRSKHIDMICTHGREEIPVEIEPVQQLGRNDTSLKSDGAWELKVATKVRRIEGAEVNDKIILVPYTVKATSIDTKRLESEVKKASGHGVTVMVIGPTHSSQL
ncbi:MAG: hypothetical protein JRN67_07735 [Nitrososphaerota archaeon]|nr:hypothetical protein [Nitrososphaerota archaeon]